MSIISNLYSNTEAVLYIKLNNPSIIRHAEDVDYINERLAKIINFCNENDGYSSLCGTMKATLLNISNSLQAWDKSLTAYLKMLNENLLAKKEYYKTHTTELKEGLEELVKTHPDLVQALLASSALAEHNVNAQIEEIVVKINEGMEAINPSIDSMLETDFFMLCEQNFSEQECSNILSSNHEPVDVTVGGDVDVKFAFVDDKNHAPIEVEVGGDVDTTFAHADEL